MLKAIKKKNLIKDIKEYSSLFELENIYDDLKYILNIYAFWKIKDKKSTLKKVLSLEKPMIRLGDGDMLLLSGNNIIFQEYRKSYKERLLKIIQDEEILLAIPEISKGHMTKVLVDVFVQCLKKDKNIINIFIEILQRRDSFYNALWSRSKNDKIFKIFRNFCKDKDIIMITSKEGSCGRYVSYFYDEARRFNIIDIKPFNAYDNYEKILENCLKQDKKVIFLLSAGPLAKILCYDLFKKGYKAIDIGHFIAEYLRYKEGYPNPEEFYKNKFKDYRDNKSE